MLRRVLKKKENSEKTKNKIKSKWWREENLDLLDERSRRTVKTTGEENK